MSAVMAETGIEIDRFAPGEMDKMPGLLAPVWDAYLNEFEGKGFPVREAVRELELILRDKFGIEEPLIR